MIHEIDNALVCEEAHKRTVKECKDKNIVCDLMEDGDIFYTPLAQEIFEKHHEDVEQEMEQNLIDYQLDHKII